MITCQCYWKASRGRYDPVDDPLLEHQEFVFPFRMCIILFEPAAFVGDRPACSDSIKDLVLLELDAFFQQIETEVPYLMVGYVLSRYQFTLPRNIFKRSSYQLHRFQYTEEIPDTTNQLMCVLRSDGLLRLGDHGSNHRISHR